MKTVSRKKFRHIVSNLYWQGHADGMVASNWGTEQGEANVSIEGVVLQFFPANNKMYKKSAKPKEKR